MTAPIPDAQEAAALASTIIAALDRCEAADWGELARMVQGMVDREALEWTCHRLHVDHQHWGLSRDIVEQRFARVRAYRHVPEPTPEDLYRKAMGSDSERLGEPSGGFPAVFPTTTTTTTETPKPLTFYGFTPRA